MLKLLILLMGIFLIAGVTAIAFGMQDGDFKFKVKKIKADKICEKDKEMNKTEKKACKDLEKIGYEIDVENLSINIMQNEGGLYRVRAQ